MAKAGGTPGKRRGIRLADRELIELADPRVQHMPVADCGESLIDVAKSGIIAYGSPPECPETAPFYRMLREEVVNRLEKAQQRLPTGLQFRLHSKLRVLAALYVKRGSGNAPNFGIRRFVELGHHP